MDSKEIVQKVYDLFGKGDMEGFMNMLHDDFVFIYPGDKHPFSGTHNIESFQGTLTKIPELWSNLQVTVESMISEGNKVFVLVKGTAEGMDTMFGHYFEVEDNQMKVMTTFDDTLTAYDAMIK